jgi:hypothetical protein
MQKESTVHIEQSASPAYTYQNCPETVRKKWDGNKEQHTLYTDDISDKEFNA